ncbi:MAG: hypothetical protein JRI43_03290 [Deltaproteobacteria bacterium]|nr:hypothetical protein [Deltaproteobacteria bacterium]MBW1912196.1 hypothetical protein [Deltaproteobacteria bacterium]
MISINATLVFQIIQFLILVFILNRLMFRPVLKIIDERRRYIQDTKAKMANIETETAELIEKCITMERDARKNAGDESSRLRKEAFAMAEKTYRDTKEEVKLIKDKIGKEVDKNLERARQSIQSEAMALADAITQKVIGRRIGN